MEKQIEELTEEMCALCKGKSVGVMIGAGLNVIQTALNCCPDKKLLLATAIDKLNAFKQDLQIELQAIT